MTCRNENTGRYFCRDLHSKGRCGEAWIQAQCAKSCSCPDDYYSAVPGRFASSTCPRPPNYPRSNFTLVVVNSHAHSPFSKVLSRTLQGMWHLVVYGNSNETRIEQTNSTIHLRVAHDSIDFTGVIAVIEHFTRLSSIVHFDRIFYMHDTMSIHNRSAFIQSLGRYSQTRTCGLKMGQSMNIGMYAVRDLFRSRSTLRTLRGPDNPSERERSRRKRKGLRGWEGVLFAQNGAWARHSSCGCALSRGPSLIRLVVDGIFRGRNELRYESWGLSKYQHQRTNASSIHP